MNDLSREEAVAKGAILAPHLEFVVRDVALGAKGLDNTVLLVGRFDQSQFRACLADHLFPRVARGFQEGLVDIDKATIQYRGKRHG